MCDISTEAELTVILGLLLYFPRLKDVYLHYATRLISNSGQHSDMSALASLFSRDTAHPLKIANRMMPTDRLAASVLLCTSLLYANDAALYRGIPDAGDAKRILDASFANQPLKNPTITEINILTMSCRQLLFLDDKGAVSRALALFPDDYARFVLLSNYYFINENLESVLSMYDFGRAGLPKAYYADGLLRMAQAYSGLRRFDEALPLLEQALENGAPFETVQRTLHIAASVSPAHAQTALALSARADAQGACSAEEQDENIKAINAQFEYKTEMGIV